MRNKYMITAMICCVLFSCSFPPLPKQISLLSVFRVTEEPAVIVRGASGSALTVNISFGDVEVEQWIQEFSKPYPLLFVDMKWAERFPETVRLIKEKNIPVGLLGDEGMLMNKIHLCSSNSLNGLKKLFGVNLFGSEH